MLGGGLSWMVIGALLGAVIADRKNWNKMMGAVVGALLGPFSILMIFAKGDVKKKCPFCATLIEPTATVCPQCRRDLPPPTAAQARR